ncbi:MAG: isoprenyl transferase [Brevinematales bacterium]
MKKEFFGIEIELDKIPQHVGIIMDGNGRWAKEKGLERHKGHEKGYQVLKDIVEFNKEIGIKTLSFYAFSTENWNRPEKEINYLFSLAKKLATEYRKTLLENKIRLTIYGSKERLPEDLIKSLWSIEEETKDFDNYTLNMVFNYGGRKEIIDGVKKILQDIKNNKINIDEIDEQKFSSYLYHPEIPDVDLLIRTSGELRISNFLLWKVAYAEIWVTKTFWPDFTPEEFVKAIKNYTERERRFGKV